jgi:hypothetical protein
VPTFRTAQTSFAGGRLGPRLRGRTDLEQYRHAAEELTNIRVLAGAAATRRPGSYFVAGLDGEARLVPFRVSSDVAYVLVFNENGTITFLRNRAPLLDSGGDPVEVAIDYLAADFAALRFAQSADTLYIFHPSYPPAKLVRAADGSWSLTTVAFADGPWGNENTGNTASAPPTPTTSAPETAAPTPEAGGSGGGTEGFDPDLGGAEGSGGNPGFGGDYEAGGGEGGEAEAESEAGGSGTGEG